MILEKPTFGANLHGCELHIDDFNLSHYFYGDTLVVDCETDEREGFVGLGITRDGKRIDYITDLDDPVVRGILEQANFIGHNLKSDLKWMIGWGLNIKSSQLFYDTMLSSYVQNTTKDSQGLKDLAKEYLGLVWPSYKEIVGTGKKKITLDKQEVGRVAAYNSMDVLGTFKLYQHFTKTLSAQETKYLEEIELPTARALLDMELRGVSVDVPYLRQLDTKFVKELNDLKAQLKTITDTRQWSKLVQTKKEPKEFNANSGFHVAALLQTYGAVLPKTQKGRFKTDKFTLEKLVHLEPVKILQRYGQIETLQTMFTSGLIEKQKGGKIYCSFNQLTKDDDNLDVGISTGRLSSSGPNLQQIPQRSTEGEMIRKSFVAGVDSLLVDGDFSQIEYRLLAHLTKEEVLLEAYRNNRDLHEETAKLILAKTELTDTDRDLGKTLNFATVYGSQAKNISVKLKVSEQEAQKFLNTYFTKLPRVTAWINRVKWEARQKKGVKTLMGRWIPLPHINSGNKWQRLHWERVAVNSTIQGSAADINKLAIIALSEAGFNLVINCHDENLSSEKKEKAQQKADEMKSIMENIVKLDVPLQANVGIGINWGEAKK